MERSQRKLIIYTLLLIICTVSIAYSLLSSSLIMHGTATIDATGVWNILFTNLQDPEVTGHASSEDVKLTATSITFLANLVLPKDTITYTFDVSNKGILNAELSSITLIEEEYVKAQHISYLLTYADGSSINIGDTLDAGQSIKMKLMVSYDDVNDIVIRDIALNLGAILIYSQVTSEEGGTS